MPTINQLVRKGRVKVKYKTASPALNSARRSAAFARASTRRRQRSRTRRCAKWRAFA